MSNRQRFKNYCLTIYLRDRRVCQKCFNKANKLDIYFKGTKPSDAVEGSYFNYDLGITVCADCRKKMDDSPAIL